MNSSIKYEVWGKLIANNSCNYWHKIATLNKESDALEALNSAILSGCWESLEIKLVQIPSAG